MESVRSLLTLQTAVGLPIVTFVLYRFLAGAPKANVPVVGSRLLFGYWGALKATIGLTSFLEEGYQKYNLKNGAFQVPVLRGWIVYVSGDLLTDVRKAKDDTLSFDEEMNAESSLEFTIGSPMRYGRKAWHIDVLRKQLTPNLGGVFPEVLDEIRFAFEKELDLPKDGEWKELCAYEAILRTVTRTTTRMFVGIPTCRNEDFLSISREFTITVAKAGFLLSVFPDFLKGFASRFISGAPKAIAAFLPYTQALVREREELKEKCGSDEWEARKPNDMLQWFMDAPGGPGTSAKGLSETLLGMNFAAIHSSSLTFTHAFYNLAANPQYAQELREEVDEAIQEHGWTRDALDVMYKIDSFVKESMRLSPILISSVARRAMKPVTLSDGTRLPKGAHVYANMWGTHHDPSLWPNPNKFDPWRFSRNVQEGEVMAKNLFTTPSTDFLFWGYGEHICPGRHFAAQEIKVMLAHVVTNYDVKMPNDGGRPKNLYFDKACIPDQSAKVLFKRRLV